MSGVRKNIRIEFVKGGILFFPACIILSKYLYLSEPCTAFQINDFLFLIRACGIGAEETKWKHCSIVSHDLSLLFTLGLWARFLSFLSIRVWSVYPLALTA